MPLIDIRDATKVYHGEGISHAALRHVTLGVEKGEFMAIMGASGSGKSTLLHILGLLDRASSGTYIFDGEDTATMSDLERARFRNERFGFVFQAFNLLPRTSVLDNVLLPLQYSRVPANQHRERAQEALQSVAMLERIEHTPAQLSGGERQRVAIARALINRPQVVFADEPTGNLDSKSGQTVMELFDALHGQGHTIVLVTHELPAAEFAQRIITLQDGKIKTDVKNGGGGHHHFTK